MNVKKVLFPGLILAAYIVLLSSFLEMSSQNITIGMLSVITSFIISLILGKVFIKSTVPALRKFSPLFYSLSLIVGIVFVSGFIVMAAQNFLSFKKAEKLIHNIDQYKQVSGQFPESLDALTPDFYSVIPRTLSGFKGKDFQYILNNNSDKEGSSIVSIDIYANEYKLVYKSAFGVEYRYLSQKNQWESSDEFDFDRIHPADFAEPITGFLISPKLSKDFK